jgi:predicted metalloprotease with PDZ domain
MRKLVAAVGVALCLCGRAHAQTPAQTPRPAGAITLAIDAREAPRRLLHARLQIPASSGPLTLVYPKWIPGEHGPTGPITNLVGLKIAGGGKPIAWTRDPVDMYAFHIDVPAGTSSLDVALDFLLSSSTEGFSSAASATPHLLQLAWNQVLVYPQGAQTDDVMFQANLQLPAGWKYATALRLQAGVAGGMPPADMHFAPTSLTMLVDSPVLSGEYFKAVPLDTSSRPIELDIAADSAAALDITPGQTDTFTHLVAEFDALFGARHFDHYNFLLTLSDHVAHFGLEHHQSNDTRLPERSLLDASLGDNNLWVLAHEFTHSWNGKYRRPAGLATPNFQEPMRGELLWVYEGLTEYLGCILAARAGLWTPKFYEEFLAVVGAYLDHRPGREWRPLIDTTVAAQLLYEAPAEWAAYRRGVDFYDEGWLIWLEADTLIRQQTQGRKSLDDFCRLFHGGTSGSPALRTYTFDDVVAAMNQVMPYDWRTFLTTRLTATGPRAPLDGVERSGWHLVYNEQENEALKDAEQEDEAVDAAYSIGLRLKNDGAIQDAIPGLPAFEAGIGPGMKVTAVNGRRWSADAFRDALKATKATGTLTLLVDNQGAVSTFTITYRDGIRVPHLERDGSKPDVLGQIIAARVK